ncbi:hypothetical protein [Ruegeria meonggei]|uniref:hypothetical protein n=1 Tax=Ruegeria meonggei TaxID=1446476 RepID=UPI00117B4B27|nr:hypothetical protein [Ruegeria meonggei]
MEDDVWLQAWAPEILKQLKRRIKKNEINFSTDQPMLLRFGAPKVRDTDLENLSFDHNPRMSNCCFAITPAFARKAVERFQGGSTTSDGYFHLEMAEGRNGVTIYPTIASDLSWNQGTLESHIHPKEKYLVHLKTQGDTQQLDAQTARLSRHIKRMFSRPFLCVGHPRTGTTFVADLLTQAGLDVGHEKCGADGISSWMFAVDAPDSPWARDDVAKTRRALHWTYMIQTVRDPATAIPSIIRENEHAPASYNFRRAHILEQTGRDLDDFNPGMERAIVSLCLWAEIIRGQGPDFVCRIEHDAESLIGFVQSKGFDVSSQTQDLKPKNADKLYKGVHYNKPEVSADEWAQLGQDAKDLLENYCEIYGYVSPVSTD